MSLLVRKKAPAAEDVPGPGLVWLRTLAPGDQFELKGEGVRGSVVRVGAGSVVVRVFKGQRKVDFTDRDGQDNSFSARVQTIESWSLNTIVVMGEKAPPPTFRRLSLRASRMDKPWGLESDMKKNKAVSLRRGKARTKAEKGAGNVCACACGAKTGGTFAPGHDARYFGWLRKVSDGRMQFKELPASIQKDLAGMPGVKARLADHTK